MKRLLLLLSGLPILASLVAAHLLGFRVLNRKQMLSISLDDILLKLKKYHPNLELKHGYETRIWAPAQVGKDGEAKLLVKHQQSKDVTTVSGELLKVGMAEIYKTHPEMVNWRSKMLKFGYFLPPFSLMVCIAGSAVGRIPAMWSLVIMALVVAGCTVMLWISRSVEKQAASTIISILETKRALHRASEEELLVEAIRAQTWISILPGILISLILKKPKDENLQSD